jgi:hypothetical protein
MTSKLSKLVLLVALTTVFVSMSYEALAAKGSGNGSATPVVDPAKADKEAEKAQKEADKLKEKEQKEAEKALKDAAKKADRIELLAKMKAAESVDDDASVEVPENEASLKYRSRGTKLSLTAEVEGFTDGDMFKMYVVINNAEVLVASLEVIGVAGDIPRQEIEFDETTWPTGVPKVLTAGTKVRLRDSKGALVFEGSLQPK